MSHDLPDNEDREAAPDLARSLRRYDREWLGLLRAPAPPPAASPTFPAPAPAHARAAQAAALDPLVVPLQLVVYADGLEHYEDLMAFERALTHIDEVVDTHVETFDNSLAEIEVSLRRPIAFAQQLRIQFDLEVDDSHPRELYINLAGSPLMTGSAAGGASDSSPAL